VVTVASGIVGALALCARDALPLELLAGSAPRAGEGRVGKEPRRNQVLSRMRTSAQPR
jgi:hypothetical protein